MKKIILILLVLIFILPVAGKDKCLIFSSPLGGYTLPWAENGKEYVNVYLNPDGTLNEKRVHEIAHEISWNGGNAAREFPFWPHKNLTIITYGGRGSAWFEDEYFSNWRRIVEIYKVYNVRICFEFFDFCGTRMPFGKWNPWNIPLGIEGGQTLNTGNFFWGQESEWLRDKYIKRMIKNLDDLDVYYGVCNEPRLPKVPVEFLIDVFCELIENGVQPEMIILPIEYNLKEQDPNYTIYYKRFREGIIKRLKNEKWAQWIKNRCISPVHGASLQAVKKILGPNPPKGGTRNIQWSQDGIKNPRPTKNMVKEIMLYIWSTKISSTKNGQHHGEVVKGKQKGDPPDSVLGISMAYKEIFGKWPENYRKHKFKYLKPGAEKPKISITSPGKGETWKPGTSHSITWTSTGAVGNIKIEYSVNNGSSWTIITPDAPNYGFYPWGVPELPPGPCKIKVSEIDGDPADMKTLTIKSTTTEPEKKKNNTWWYVVLAAVGAVVLFLFIKHTVITALIVAGLLLIISYFGYRKKWKYYYLWLIGAFLVILGVGILANNLLLIKALFGGAMGVIAILALKVDSLHKRIRKCYHRWK